VTGEYDLVALIEAYFDESGSHSGSSALCIAGYLFEKTECQALDLAWKRTLEKYHLPYFHMVDCAHGNHPFDKLDRDQRIAVESEMIQLIRQHMLFGTAITVDEVEYNGWYARERIGSAYTYCCWQTLAGIRSWLERNNFQGEVAYFFEAGHKNHAEANAIMNMIFSQPELRSGYRYSSHAFVDKKKVRPVQTADIFAWLHANHFKRRARGEFKPRGDFKALVEKPKSYEIFIANSETVSSFITHGSKMTVEGSLGPWRFRTAC
jgi:hypothetical protein